MPLTWEAGVGRVRGRGHVKSGTAHIIETATVALCLIIIMRALLSSRILRTSRRTLDDHTAWFLFIDRRDYITLPRHTTPKHENTALPFSIPSTMNSAVPLKSDPAPPSRPSPSAPSPPHPPRPPSASPRYPSAGACTRPSSGTCGCCRTRRPRARRCSPTGRPSARTPPTRSSWRAASRS